VKLTKQALKRIIKEELTKILLEGSTVDPELEQGLADLFSQEDPAFHITGVNLALDSGIDDKEVLNLIPWEVKSDLASKEDLDDERILSLLSKDEHPAIKHRVAKNPNTPTEALIRIAKNLETFPKGEDSKRRVRVTGVALVNNPNTTIDVLKVLAKINEVHLSDAIIGSPKVTPELINWIKN
jgi:hypothetical protein